MTGYRDLLPIIVETSGAQMPDGFNSWGIKSVHPGLTAMHGFRWASPGGTNVSNDHLLLGNTSACPRTPGDGLCVAGAWRGMASAGIPARTLLLVAYRSADVVGRDELAGKLRISGEVATVALIDGERLIREHGRGADLRGADLRGADLRGADLRDADLRDADLQGTDLQGANLQGTDLQRAGLQRANLLGARLQGANLHGAHLQGADLRYANLHGANLRNANLRHVDLRGADLQDACLQYANLRHANLRHVDLRGADLQDACLQYADLQGADLQRANLQRAVWPVSVALPDGWTLTSNGCLTRKVTQ